MLGGWLSLTDEQSFCCSPGSHLALAEPLPRGGFAKLSEAEGDRHDACMRRVPVPAGAVVLFFSDVVHQVVSLRRDSTMWRLFVGVALTGRRDEHPLGVDHMRRVMRKQSRCTLPSGQDPPMRPHGYFFPAAVRKQQNFLGRIDSSVREHFRFLSPASGDGCVVSHAPSLAQLDLRYAPYTEAEQQLVLRPLH